MDNCPTCLREFRDLEDYPYIYIAGFDRGKLPELVTGFPISIPYHESHETKAVARSGNPVLPEGILNLFQETGKDTVIHEGIVWKKDDWGGEPMYSPFNDLTPGVRQAYENPEIQRYLESLESYVGRDVRTRDILPTWERGERFRAFWLPNQQYSVKFHEKDKAGDYRNSDLNLMGHGPNMGRAGGPTLMILMTLGTITYEGRLNVLSPV